MDLIAYVVYRIQDKKELSISFDRMKNDIDGLIQKSSETAQKNGMDPADYALARFAVFVWVDETVLKSSWDEKHLWRKSLLQRRYYKTTGGGAQFFERLSELEPYQSEVREMFYLCLALGFSGKYGATGSDLMLLDSLKATTLKRLTGTSDGFAQIGKRELFPEAYPEGDNTIETSDTSDRKWRFAFFSLALSPVVILLLLFILYRFVLNNEMVTTLVS